MTDFVGDCVDYVRRCSEFTGQHYPERVGTVLIINVPGWFKLIWNVVKPMVDPVTLEKIHIVRGKKESLKILLQKIPIENIPPEYGGKSVPLGEALDELLLRDLMKHNNDLAQDNFSCKAVRNPCRFCNHDLVRSY